MNFKQLEYFCAAAESQSITAAARALHMAHPPVGRQIALLEEELGVRLFSRTNKGIRLTQAGSYLYRQSQEMFRDLRAMVDSVQNADLGLRGTLRIGTIYSDSPLATEYLKEYRRRYPKVELYVRLGAPADLLADLDQGKLHALFLRGHTKAVSGLHQIILGEDPLELVMTDQTDPDPGAAHVPIQALENVPMCLLRSDDLWGYSSRLIDECRQAGFSPDLACQCYDAPMVMQMVRAGFGISYLPRTILGAISAADIYTKPIQGVHVSSQPTVVWGDALPYASCAKRFLSMVRERLHQEDAIQTAVV